MVEGLLSGALRALREVNPALFFWMGSWYLCSLVTLFMNKTILSELGGDQYVLGISQMVMTAVLGGAKVYGPMLCQGPESDGASHGRVKKYTTFWRDMILVGVMRGATVILGLVSLSHVAVSFTETVKSSAPFFTVILSWFMLGQRTSWEVCLSLVPVMLGLALSSATELSFDTIGFLAAVLNNIVDCIQNVFSKKLLQSMTPVQLQFYTSAAAAVLQLPVLCYLLAPQLVGASSAMRPELVHLILVDAVFYHLQSVTAYCTMNLLTPVSQSVANTVKRAALIFLSILWFGNEISWGCAVGMLTVTVGVLFYNHARIHFPAKEVTPDLSQVRKNSIDV
jgi:solute carrier family 35 protein E2